MKLNYFLAILGWICLVLIPMDLINEDLLRIGALFSVGFLLGRVASLYRENTFLGKENYRLRNTNSVLLHKINSKTIDEENE